MRPLAYIIIERGNLPDLETAVNSLLNATQAWVPQGGVSVVYIGPAKMLYTQAMVATERK